jgi:membrane associated rhomboid family serine protease
MVLPLYDDNRDRRRFPVVNYAFIIINILVFVFPQELAAPKNKFTYAFSTVPYEIVHNEDWVEPIPVKHPITGEPLGIIDHQPTPISVYLTLLTSMFMHGSIAHILGNMLFLWIFGDNVEDYLGHVRYVIFYLVCGLLASLAHVGTTYLFGMNPLIPSLGASGAISGVLGGYVLLFPQRRVMVIMFRFLTEVPAFVAIGLWFLFQIINSLGAFGDGAGGGVAYGAHIGGFLAGLVLVKAFAVGVFRETYRRGPDPYRRSPPRMWR